MTSNGVPVRADRRSRRSKVPNLIGTLLVVLASLGTFVGVQVAGVQVAGATTVCSGYNYAGCNLSNNNYTGSNFSYYNFSGTNFTNDILTRVTMGGVYYAYVANSGNFDGANFTGTTLTGAAISGIGTPTGLPANWKAVACPTPWLTVGYSSGATYLVGPSANMTGWPLTSCSLANANLTGATLTNDGLGNVDFTGTTLTGVISGGISGTPINLPTGWVVLGGYLIGPGANLTGANLAGLDLTGLDLTGATLTGATLTGATLTGVASGGIIGAPNSLPSNWILVGGYLVGPSANLTNAAFHSATLTGANLTNANLTSADLTMANLTGSSLTGATLSGAGLAGATLTGAGSGGIVGTPASLPTNWTLVNGNLIGPPGAPTSVVATLGAGSASVSFTSPVANGSAITSYTVTAADSTSSGRGGQTASGSSSPVVISGLVNGDSYSFVVTATNAAGTGSPSATSNGIVPVAVPTAPSNVTASPGNQTITVSWTGSNAEGSPVASYTVSSPSGLGCTTTATSCGFSGLTNGTSYSFTVTATNAIGVSPLSATASTTPSTIPSVALNFTATQGNQSITLSWSAPNNGGSAITGYTVVKGTDSGCVTTGTSCTVTGLTNNTRYGFAIYTTNVNGNGALSTSIYATPEAPPGPPTNIVATPRNLSATVTWTGSPPVSTTQGTVSSYLVTAADATNSAHGGQTCSTATTSCTVAGRDC